ncbi:ROK family transcriptional regulator [Bogoriella caseilytica]|uniref:Putative NBD/HSP70 family sugar kinase n=1 Tax=Bogoriella caseilytica TaxID=56055 RepID=A0A3N2BAX3_9MICO|nr:ROK family transcriptional regulator [Bogoriella caseilytica]ROR72397.1 putative NBD/HSP70 family sugar kinase [Bogoriella caseilytica]
MIAADSARQSTLREHNLALVCGAIFAGDAPSRAGVAAATGLTRSTVSRLADELIQARLVAEQPAALGRPGRPAVPLTPAAGTVAGLGLHANVDYLAARAVDLTGAVLAEERLDTDSADSHPPEVLARLAELGKAVRDRAEQAGATVAQAVLGLPGLVDPAGRLLVAPNLGWHEVRPAPLLAEELGVSVTVANDAHLAAYGIAREAPGRMREGWASFIYLAGDVGVGSALVEDGRVALGRHGWSGEIGHVCVDPAGPPCHCGARGCLEAYAGRRELETRPAAEVARALGIALSSALNVVDAAAVVLGTGFVPVFDQLRPGVEAELFTRVLGGPWAEVALHPAPDDALPAATGGAYRALEAVITHPAARIGLSTETA